MSNAVIASKLAIPPCVTMAGNVTPAVLISAVDVIRPGKILPQMSQNGRDRRSGESMSISTE